MKPGSAALFDKARRSRDAARLLLANGSPDFAASRAYYAAFYAAEAFLLERGMAFSTHSGVIGAFAMYAVKEAGLPSELHRIFQAAFEHRSAADYGPEFRLSYDDTARLIDSVAHMVDTVERHLQEHGEQ